MSGLKQHKQLCYTIKQQLSRELAIEKVRNAEKFKSKNDTNSGNEKSASSSAAKMFNQKNISVDTTTTTSAAKHSASNSSQPSSPTVKTATTLMELMSHRTEIKPNVKKQMFKVIN